jgi:hypothetical protein
MEKEQRSKLQKATQEARRILEEEFSRQLLETYDINVAAGRWSEEPGAHLQAEQRLLREKLLAWIEHRSVQINDEKEALLLALREMAFTALNRFVALKLMEARELVRPCVSGGLESEGFQEFTAVAQGLLADQEGSYRLYLETIFEDVSRELRALFDPRDPASLLWPKRTALLDLLDILNRPELAELWREDETLGWIYQYFNGDAERKKMREESSAPRNSRELAVRNQFFTPRYVVEFLTDNTLGRIWYEMRQGNTGLKERCRYLVRRPNEIWLQSGEEAPAEVVADEALSQEELLRQPVHIPLRPLKDPREIRMLDPACGSMHFGLYAFDLYLAIYGEAWEVAKGSDEQAKQGEAFAPFVAYAADFASKAAFLCEVPRLILLHNIHGVDIDPRATQIARLTLWLRAQRAWQEQEVEIAARPAITRSDVVCAEPMPGERELLADFVDQEFPEAERGLVQQLLETIFDKMQLAGEAGSLLKIEEEIRDAIEQARREWHKLAIQQRDLFSAAELAALGGVGSSLNTDLQNLTKDFWVTIEDRIYDALRDYADQAESGGYQRRLFAEDAAQGFAFIDVCRKRYDVTLMNPPFGEGVGKIKESLSNWYPLSWKDLLTTFVDIAEARLLAQGYIGAISSRTPFFIGSAADWRAALLERLQLDSFADLGGDILDSMVETAAFVLHKPSGSRAAAWKCVAHRVSSHPAIQRKELLLSGIAEEREGNADENTAFVVSLDHINSLPLVPFVYWMRDEHRSVYGRSNSLEENGILARGGGSTADDFRYIRLATESPIFGDATGRYEWVRFAKGGAQSKFYFDVETKVIWDPKRYTYFGFTGRQGRTSIVPESVEHYFTPGLTFPRRTSLFAPRALPEGCAFGKGAQCLVIKDIDPLKALAVCASRPFHFFLSIWLGRIDLDPQYEVGPLQLAPFPDEVPETALELAKEAYCIMLLRDCSKDTKSVFHFPAILRAAEWKICLTEAYERLAELDRSLSERLEVIADELDGQIASGYGLSSSSWTNASRFLPSDRFALALPRLKQASEDLVDWLVGIPLGRWDVRMQSDPAEFAAKRDPFAPLPILQPGLLLGNIGGTALHNSEPSRYPLRVSWSGILVDDENHPEDIVARVREAIEAIWKDRANATEQETCGILDVKSLRNYFSRPAAFFAQHLGRYSNLQRQSPIYWQLSVGSGSYSIWLYYHHLTQDTLYRVLRDFVDPRIQQVEREQFEFESQGAISGDAATILQEGQGLLQDLQLLKSELDLVSPLWNPNLNDGVIINHAILWRITPYSPWQKNCKECWDKLVKGDYDWAHLAFHLWPERVIRKCTTDRSLAIAHGLEERLWQETSKGNWLQRQVSEVELQALLAEYSKPAVQNALERFLAAPPPVAAARTRAPRAAKSSSTGTTRRPRGSAPEVDAETSRQTLLVLTAAPSEGLGRNAIAELLAVEAASLTAVIKQLKEGGQIEQLGAARGAKYRLSESGLAAVESQAGEDE